MKSLTLSLGTCKLWLVKEEMNVDLESTISIFALYPPTFSLASKKRFDSSNYLSICKNYRDGVSPIPKIYAIAQEESPTGSPQQAVKPSNDVHSVSSATSNRTGQEDFNDRVLSRDNFICLFCSFSGTPLYGAHIFGHKEFNKIPIPSKRECLDSYSISGINDTSNGFTLCWNCHQAFDNYLVCVDPVTSILLVTEALQEHEPTKWKLLHKKYVTPAKFNWPSKELVTYRFNKMHAKKMKERYKILLILSDAGHVALN